jgi:hypothetical protein
VVHDRGGRKSAMPAAEPAGRRSNGTGEHRKEIAEHAGVSRRSASATLGKPGKPRY